MLPFVLAMQLAAPSVVAPNAATVPPTAPQTVVAPPPVTTPPSLTPTPSPAPTAAGPPWQQPDVASPRARAEERANIMWRLELGAGTGGVNESNRLLREAGYGSGQLWITTDVYGLIHPNIGIGGQLGMARTQSDQGVVALNQVLYYGAVQATFVPWRIERKVELQLIPRVGLGSGGLSFNVRYSDADDTPGDTRIVPVFGAAAALAFPFLHLSVGAGYLHAPGAASSDFARTHDFGGFYGTLGGTIDG